MSRIGKKPINIPAGVTVAIQGGEVAIKGRAGEEKIKLHPNVAAKFENGQILVSVKNPENKQDRALWGLFRALLANNVKGVVDGFEKKLELQGVGFKASLEGQKITLDVGFSHQVYVDLPAGIKASIEKNVITLKGTSKELVGEIAARIRAVRKPEPYQGKGIHYLGEVIRRKAGKAAKTAAAGAGAGK